MIRVYGYSDDIVEIESDDDKQFHNEFYVPDGQAVIAISDGTLLEIRFDKWGVWRITPITKGSNFDNLVSAETEIQTDYAYINERGIEWIVLSKEEIRP